MAQTITDFNTFLEDAKSAVSELSELNKKEAKLSQREAELEKTLEAEKKAVTDTIATTVQRRRSEIGVSYDNEIDKIQDQLKKVRTKREKAKNQGMKERIGEETKELTGYNRELKVRMKTLFQKERVPAFCNSGLYYSLYFPRGLRELLTFLAFFALCFLLVPYGIYLFLPPKTLYLVLIYVLCILIFGGLYTMTGNRTRGRHLEALREGRTIRNLIKANHRKMRIITGTIRKDRNETAYHLDSFDDEMTQIDQELSEMAAKKKDALSTFENMTRSVIEGEITENSREKLESLKKDYEEAAGQLRYTQTMVKEKKIYITDTYESYLGKEFLQVDKLEALRRILTEKEASNLSEAIEVYKNRANQTERG